jgi:hypothetical protein
MVFGSDKRNPTHWKQLFKSESETRHQRFRDGLFQATGFARDTWDHYWQSMTDFRNRYAAHRELSFESPIPNFDNALEIACYYDSWVRKAISPYILAEPTLESFALSLESTVTPFVERLLEATK